MISQPNRTLAQLLAIRMILVALGVSFALIALTAAYYMLDTPELRRLTLELQVRRIVDAVRRGDDPATWKLYKAYPRSYGFRVFDHQAGVGAQTDRRGERRAADVPGASLRICGR